jgi:hypothetical protein
VHFRVKIIDLFPLSLSNTRSPCHGLQRSRDTFLQRGRALRACQHTSAYASIWQHTSAYASIRQHMSAYGSIRQHTRARAARVSRKMWDKSVSGR